MFYISVYRESVQRLGEDDCDECIMIEEDDDDCVLVKVDLGMQLWLK